MKLSDFSAVILDMDGLVLDTEKTYFSAWQKAAEKMGFQLTDSFCQSLSGLHFQAIERILLNTYGASFDVEQFRNLSGEFWYAHVNTKGISVKKGFYSLIVVIKQLNMPYCLATNSFEKNALECLAFAGLSDYFPVMVTRDQVKLAKPAPDIFLHAAALLNKQIKTCLVVEDSPVGLQAAKTAGAYTAYIPSSHSKKVEIADLYSDDLGQLAEFIKDAMMIDRV